MKQFKTVGLIVVSLFFTGITFAQTADQIISNYFKNSGGEQNWENLQTVTMKVKMTTNGMEMSGTIYSKRPDKLKTVFNYMGKNIVAAYDGKDAWMENPFMPDSTPQLVPEAMAKSLKQNSFESKFLNYAAKGYTVELTGSDTLNGQDVYEIKLTKKDGDIEYHYFDKDNFMNVMMKKYVSSGPQNKTEADVYFSDFRKVGGLKFPFFMESQSGGQTLQKMIFTDIEINKPLDDSIFAFPKK